MYAAGRITHLQPMHWENDWPIIGVNKEGNDYGEPVMQYVKPNIGKTAEELKDTDKYQYVSQTQQMNLILIR